MIVRSRLLGLVSILLLTLSLSGVAFAQADPNDPIQDPESTVEPTAEAEHPNGNDPTNQAQDEEGIPLQDDTSPLTPDHSVDLAAMTLDGSGVPDEFFFYGENYITIEQLIDNLVGLLDEDELLATGIQDYYESYFGNADGNTLRTYVISFDSVEGARAGFAMLEDEETLVPNGSLEDLPALDGVGEEPAEITSGTIENGDGTQSRTYDISFLIDRFEVGAAMETYDGSEPDREVVEQMAVDLADRVEAVLAGDDVDGVDYALPGQLIALEGATDYEGYETAEETFLISDPENLPSGYISGYYRAVSYSDNITTYLPYVTVGISSFESTGDAEDAIGNPDSIMPLYPNLEEIDGIEIAGADEVLAFSFTSPGSEGDADSVRIFLLAEDRLISIDAQGFADLDEAEAIAVDLAEAEIGCLTDGDCGAVPVVTGDEI